MSKIALLLLVVGSLFVTAFALQRETASAAAGPCDASSDVSPAEQELLTEINAWRAAVLGADPMQLSAPANKAAQWYADQTVLGLTSPANHGDAYGRNWAGRLADCGYDPIYAANGAGEALAIFLPDQLPSGASSADAVASITNLTPGHQNGVQAPAPWQCAGVGFASNPAAAGNAYKYVWVVVVAQSPTQACSQSVLGGGGGITVTPATSTPTNTATPTSTPTRTRTPTPSPTPSANYNRTITITQGWNLVTLPAGSLNDILDTARRCFSAVYEPSGADWLRYVPDAPSYASNLSASAGGVFWILGTNANCGAVRI